MRPDGDARPHRPAPDRGAALVDRRLRRSDPDGPGITRRRRGKGFSYDAEDGERVTDPRVLSRIRSLVIPPAWREVWICPSPSGHIQAVGIDDAGRRQYRYHDLWRLRRDAEKFDRLTDFAASLPAAREQAAAHLAEPGLTRNRVLGAAFRLLDLGFFRCGGEEYAAEHGTFGLATMLREHVTVHHRTVTFTYPGKNGTERVQSVVDEDVRRIVLALLRRPAGAGGPELLAYRAAPRDWRGVPSSDITGYVGQVTGSDATAKDFRTWHGTVLAAVGLAVSTNVPSSRAARKRAVARAVTEVAEYLGNTPAVARESYIDPRVIDQYRRGVTIAKALTALGDVRSGDLATHGATETAVLRLLRDASDPLELLEQRSTG